MTASLGFAPQRMDAAIALAHLGGPHAVQMIGGRASAGDRELVVKFKARAKDGINAFAVYLDAADLYRIRFLATRMRPTVEVRVVEDTDGVDCESLKTFIAERLGVRLSLF